MVYSAPAVEHGNAGHVSLSQRSLSYQRGIQPVGRRIVDLAYSHHFLRPLAIFIGKKGAAEDSNRWGGGEEEPS